MKLPNKTLFSLNKILNVVFNIQKIICTTKFIRNGSQIFKTVIWVVYMGPHSLRSGELVSGGLISSNMNEKKSIFDVKHPRQFVHRTLNCPLHRYIYHIEQNPGNYNRGIPL